MDVLKICTKIFQTIFKNVHFIKDIQEWFKIKIKIH